MTAQLKQSLPSDQIRAAFLPETVDEKQRTVEVAWSTGAKVRRYSWSRGEEFLEELSLESDAVRLERLNSGAPLLNAHSRWSLNDIIGVVDKAWLATGEDGKKEGRAVVRFSAREDVEPIFRDVKDGIIRNVSVGYSIHKMVEVESGDETTRTMRVVDYTPFEISLVPVGADAGAGVRSHEQVTECLIETFSQGVRSMAEKEPNPAPTAQPAQAASSADAVRAEAMQQERLRTESIFAEVRKAKLSDDFALDLIKKGTSVEQARALIIDEWSKQGAAGAETRQHTRVEMVRDERETTRSLMANALSHRADGRSVQLEDGAKQFRHLSLIELARSILTVNGEDVRMMSRDRIAERALHSTSDFPLILGNVASRSLRRGYEVAPRSFQPFVRVTELADFKEVTRAMLGQAPSLEKMVEGAPYTAGSVKEAGEKYKLATYGRKILISRQAIINDDLEAFTRVPERFGTAAANLESDLVFSVLTANAALADGVALFHATHKNLAASGGAIDITTLGAARKAMRSQVDLDGKTVLNIQPKFLLVPAALETIAQQYLAQIIAQDSTKVNPFQGTLVPIAEARLDAASATAWYVIADPAQVDTIELAFLEGERGVQIERMTESDTDGLAFKARLDVAAKAIDHRGMYKNAGV